MRVLIVHNRYLQRGGEDQSVEARVRLLRDLGHSVDTLFEDNARLATLGQIQAAAQTLWSQESYCRIRNILQTGDYDVMDAHNTVPLVSPAAYYAARAEGTAVVQTLHNYRLLCPSANLYRSGQPCEDCVGRRVAWPGVQHACYRGNRRATAAIAAMLAVHRAVGTWTRTVDAYLALTQFARAKFIEGGLPADKLVVAPNFIDPDPGVGDHSGAFALFVGRLAREKGILNLLAAWKSVGHRLPLLIVGDGPLSTQVASTAATTSGIEWLGKQTPDQVKRLMGTAKMVIVPSEWYETFGLVVIEAFARGTPVVASRIGALAELIDDGDTGLLFLPGNPDSLVESVQSLVDRPSVGERVGAAARRKFENTYSATQAAPAILAGYEMAINSRRAS